MRTTTASILCLTAIAAHVDADTKPRDHDFAIVDQQCKMTTSTLTGKSSTVSKASEVSVVDGEKMTDLCWRDGRSVRCEVWAEKRKIGLLELQILVETPALLRMANKEGNTVIWIDPRTHGTVVTERVFDTSMINGSEIPYVITKMCSSYYLTAGDLAAYRRGAK